MPANLTPEYRENERKFREARDPEEKLRYLELMLATIPKHKGTDHMQGDIKRRISQTRAALEKKSGLKRHNPFKVEREGIGQFAVVGAANVGKSAIVGKLTNAKTTVADYAFTTTKPVPGMMPFENVQIQIVDLPPVSEEFTEPAMVGMIRNTDGVILVFDLTSADPAAQIEGVRGLLLKYKAKLCCSAEERYTLDGIAHLKAFFVGNKLESAAAEENLKIITDLYGADFSVFGVSAEREFGLDEIRRTAFEMLDVIRVYTKSPGKKPDFDEPVVLKRGATVIDFGASIHKDFAKSLKFARIWSKDPTKFEGQKVNRDEVLFDGDVLELHI
ncbi:MAG: TGS domain-containing protein [Deltaproteobacteria bacterium]|nr:TGS domain-containing protein [Candidatus Zymogenaceae bacterium]